MGRGLLLDFLVDRDDFGRTWCFTLYVDSVDLIVTSLRPARRFCLHSHHLFECSTTLMNNRLPGETPISFIKGELGLTASAAKDLRTVLRDDTHDLTKALARLGVCYMTTGMGRGARSYLLKR
jgi:hypothetical protein